MEDEDGDQTLMPRHVHNTRARESGIGSPVFPFFLPVPARGNGEGIRVPVSGFGRETGKPPAAGPFPDSAGNRDRESGSRFGGRGISWSDVIVTSELHSIVRNGA